MPWPFEREYMQLALVAGLVVGACAPLIGAFLVQKRMSLLGDGIGHLAFAGVAAGLLLDVWPVWTALAVSVLGAVALERLRARGSASGDLALALFFYGGIAGGVVLIGLAESLNANIFSFLFGSLLTVSAADVWTVVVIGALIVLTIALSGRALFAVVADEEWARVAGLPVDRLNTLLAVLTAVTIVAAMRVVGVLLIAALMVLPVASGQLLARSFRRALVWSVAVGIVSVVLGLVAARQWALAPGGSIVLVAASAFGILSAITGGSRGGSILRRSHSG
ncbi:MAG: metal ABC transporter permease [Actinobacteria bacterium]|nr:metal ABC transporter permease [Actinomycetota bacterium]